MIDELAFPRTAKYDERWIRENALGENALCQAEYLARHLPFSAGMRVLELGCGKATGSILLAREIEVQMWDFRVTDTKRQSMGAFPRRNGRAMSQFGTSPSLIVLGLAPQAARRSSVPSLRITRARRWHGDLRTPLASGQPLNLEEQARATTAGH